MHNFRKLDVYQKGLKLGKRIRATTRKFPKEELFVLTSQFRRAADSIVLNIAEGAGNTSKKEFEKFLGYSIRSGYECVGCSDIALTEDFLSAEEHTSLCKDIDEVISMLVGLQKSLNKNNQY